MKIQQKNIVGVILSMCFALLYACSDNTLDSGTDCPNNLDDVFVCGTFPTEMQGEWGVFDPRGSAWPTTRSGNKEMEIDSTSIYLRGSGSTGFPAYGTYINAGVDSTNKTLGNIMTNRRSADVVTDKVKVANTTLSDWTGAFYFGFIPSSDVRFGIVGDKNNLKVILLAGSIDTYNVANDFVETISTGDTFWEFTLVGESTAAYNYNISMGSTTATGYIGTNRQIVKWK